MGCTFFINFVLLKVMAPLLLIIILLALVTESFSTSWYSGAIHKKLALKLPIQLPFALAIIKSLMMALGIYIGNRVYGTLPSHFTIIAYSLMFIVSLKIIWESMRFAPEERIIMVDSTKTLLLLSFAGSFNTFLISICLGLIGVHVLNPCIFTLTTTIVFALAAVNLGAKHGLRPFIRISGIVAGLLITILSLRFIILYLISA